MTDITLINDLDQRISQFDAFIADAPTSSTHKPAVLKKLGDRLGFIPSWLNPDESRIRF